MKNKIYLRFVYNVNGQVFNLASGESANRYDPIFNRSFGFGTSDNIKHCIRELFKLYTKINETASFFEKVYSKDNVENKKKSEQGQVYTEVDLENPYGILFGLFNPSALPGKSKYKKISLSSVFNVGDFMPLHTLLCKYNTKEFGVRRGDLNSKVIFYKEGKKDDAKNFAATTEEIVENFKESEEKANAMLKLEKHPYNFFEKTATSSGIYYVDYNINFENFIKVNINDVDFTEQEKEEYASKGFEFIQEGKNEFVIMPKELVINFVRPLIEAIVNFDFMSNRSTHGTSNELLRIAVSSNAHLTEQSTMAELVSEDKAKLSFIDGDESDEKPINSIEYSFKTYNSLLLKHFVTKEDGLTTNINAINNAIEDLVEYGETYIKNYQI